MKLIGYWRNPEDPETSEYPDPANLVDPSWDEEERFRVVSYLKQGRMICGARGLSWCRFQCGCPDLDMGSRELSDGEWVWPEGLAHYVEAHLVRLPDEFIQSCSDRAWTIDTATNSLRLSEFVSRKREYLSYWLEWASNTLRAEQAMDVNRPFASQSPTSFSATTR